LLVFLGRSMRVIGRGREWGFRLLNEVEDM
jgi:hypothetical protein